MILPGGKAYAHFTTTLSGTLQTLTRSAAVWRNGTLTTVVPTITDVATGRYVVEFDVPVNWTSAEVAFIELTVNYGAGDAEEAKLVKRAGAVQLFTHEELATLITRALDVVEADEAFDRPAAKVRKFRRGTNVLLLEKNLTGTSCVESVSLTE